MKPFNLEEAKAGKPVCTRDGRPVRILCFDTKGEETYPILALITTNDREDCNSFTKDGNFWIGKNDQPNDLMMASIKKEGYISLINPKLGNDNVIMGSTNVYSSEEECHERFSKVTGYIKTIKIEWEE